MMDSFEIGVYVEIVCVGNKFPTHEKWIGHKGFILCRARADWPKYPVRWEVEGVVASSGIPFAIQEQYLRIIKPPEKEINWVEKLELKNWNPTEQKVTHV